MEPTPRRSGLVTTVNGLLAPSALGVIDAHQHVWIAPVAGGPADAPLLCDRDLVAAGLASYRAAGGGSLLDCQPGGCGRDGRVLAELARVTGVPIIACTGFHLAHYYPPDIWLWRARAEAARDYFVAEIAAGLAETRDTDYFVRAGFIKIACPADPAELPPPLWEAAAAASRETNVVLMVHTEVGAAAEQIVSRLVNCGAAIGQLVLCHIDKRPDFGLHRALAQAGVLLEYDTFHRPKYQPEHNVWPLLARMVAEGLAGQIAIGTDLAGTAFWQETGPTSLPGEIVTRLRGLGFDAPTVRGLTGGNIADRLAGQALS
jgi:5-phospho-D-xylono-1,4-lactonase